MWQSYCPDYVDPVRPLDIPMVRHDNESNYVPRLVTFVEHADTLRGLMGLEPCCLGWLYDGYYSIRDADAWCQELDFEIWQRHGLARRLLGWHDTEVSALPQAGPRVLL